MLDLSLVTTDGTMFVKEISLDGFKSYAQRVDINGFDPQFNAITGLNGSGKSNILDSICFVLGIQNLQQVCREYGWKISCQFTRLPLYEHIQYACLS